MLLASASRKWRVGAIIAVLIGIFEAQLLLSVPHYSQTIDESVHIFSGYEYWHYGDFGANPEHPPLVKFVATVPLLFQNIRNVPLSTGPTKASTDAASTRLLYQNDARRILFSTRGAVSIFGIVLLVLCSLWAYEAFGGGPALVVASLIAFDPNLITNAGLVTADMGITCLSVAVVYSLYRFLNRPTIARLLICGFALGLALASKHSAILLPPIMCVLFVSEWWTQRKQVGIPRFPLTTGWRLLLAIVAIFVIAWSVLWVFDGFRFEARPAGLELQPKLDAYARTLQGPMRTSAISFMQQHRLLPESYLWGLTDVLLANGGRATFILGKVVPDRAVVFLPSHFSNEGTAKFADPSLHHTGGLLETED